MIERYSRPEMSKVWELESRFRNMLEVELAVCKVRNRMGLIPDDVLESIISKADFNLERIAEIEEEVKHDIIAFLTCVNEHVGDAGRYIHVGMTSSDVIDTGLALQMKNASNIIRNDLEAVVNAIRAKAKEHKNTVTIGRSHGIHAEPMTFGVKLCLWLDLFQRCLDRFNRAADDAMTGQISGPIGTYSNIEPEVETQVCEELGLKPAAISTQVIQRDIHAYYMQALALIASVIEQCATEIRHLQRTEVLEVEEGFSKGQKGSSAMPHKKNPISSENLCGLARVVRSNSIAALENISLWHERDISHSSVERIILPDSTILIDYMLNRFRSVVENLNVYPENMLKNTCLYGGVIYSQRVLIELTEKGLSRESAYSIVQDNAHRAWNKPDGNFKNNLLNDCRVKDYLTDAEIEQCFDPNYYLRNVEKIYERFGV